MPRIRIAVITGFAVLAAVAAVTAAVRTTRHEHQARGQDDHEVTIELASDDGPYTQTAAATAASKPAPDAGAANPADSGVTKAPAGPKATTTAQAPRTYFDNPDAPSLRIEMAALGAARYYVHVGDFTRALEQLQRLAERFPNGGLRSERVAELAIVHCALGQRSAAREALQRLQRAKPAPAKALIDRARAACKRSQSPG